MTDFADETQPRRLYRDTEQGFPFGVRAGLADYFGLNLFATRCFTLLAFCVMPVTMLMYLGAIFVLKKKPRQLQSTPFDEDLSRSVRRDPHHIFHLCKHRFREMETRVRRMERYVTSPRYRLDREFDNLRS